MSRLGTVFASNRKAYSKWLRQAAPKQRPKSDAELEAAIVRIGQMFPGSVTRGVAP